MKKRWRDLQLRANRALEKHEGNVDKVLDDEIPARRKIMEKVLRIVQHNRPDLVKHFPEKGSFGVVSDPNAIDSSDSNRESDAENLNQQKTDTKKRNHSFTETSSSVKRLKSENDIDQKDIKDLSKKISEFLRTKKGYSVTVQHYMNDKPVALQPKFEQSLTEGGDLISGDNCISQRAGRRTKKRSKSQRKKKSAASNFKPRSSNKNVTAVARHALRKRLHRNYNDDALMEYLPNQSSIPSKSQRSLPSDSFVDDDDAGDDAERFNGSNPVVTNVARPSSSSISRCDASLSVSSSNVNELINVILQDPRFKNISTERLQRFCYISQIQINESQKRSALLNEEKLKLELAALKENAKVSVQHTCISRSTSTDDLSIVSEIMAESHHHHASPLSTTAWPSSTQGNINGS